MIKELYTLSKKYENKKIYIWNTNRNSLMVFAKLAHKRINVCGFVTTGLFVGEYIMNRLVVNVSAIEQQKEVLIIIADECKKRKVQEFLSPNSSVEIVGYSESLAVDYRLKDKNVILYGRGEGSRYVKGLLNEVEVDILGYVLTKVTAQDKRLADKPVFTLEQLSQKKEATVVITAMANNKHYQWEMLQSLERVGIEDIYLNGTFVTDQDINNSITFQTIDRAYKENKKIYIYGKADEYGNLIKDILKIYGIPCEGFLDEYGLYDKYYEENEKRFFIVNAIQPSDLKEKCDQLEQMGISINDLSYTGLGYVNIKSPCRERIPDCLCDFMPLYTDFNGINIHGNREAKYKIAVFGGSTSTSRWFRPKSWVEFLYDMLQNEIGDIVIYNFANAGNDVVIELLKLLRDGYHVKPNYVISFSGLNNVWHKKFAVNQFHVVSPIKWIKHISPDTEFNAGLEIEEDPFEFWVRIQKIIKAVAQIYGADYLGILQPMNIGKENKNLIESMMFEYEETKEGAKSFHDNSKDDDFYLNLMKIFENEENMYIDPGHYNEKANEIIAEKIFNIILKNREKR